MVKPISTVKYTGELFDLAAREELFKIFSELPFVRLTERTEATFGGRTDLALQVDSPHFSKTVIVEFKSSGEPRLVRDAANQLYYYTQHAADSVALFAAPYISPKAAAILEERGINYFDLAGNCRIVFDYVFIKKEGHKNPEPDNRRLKSLYSPKAERIVRILLNEPRRSWKVEPLAEACNVSLGQVSKVKHLLEDREWIRSGAAGFQLTAPEELLTEWASNYRFGRGVRRDYYRLGPIRNIEVEIAAICDDVGLQYAFSGLSGAAKYAPYARADRVFCYLESAQAEQHLRHVLSLKSVSSGQNITFVVPLDEGVFDGAQLVNDLWVASPIQCFLDLKHGSSRSDEAAEFLKDQVITPSW